MKSNNNKSLGLLFFCFYHRIFLAIIKWRKCKNMVDSYSYNFSYFSFGQAANFKPLTKLWIKFGELIGKFISPIVIGLIYFVILTPIGLLMRLFNKDLLNLKFSKESSYWIKRETKLNSMDKQY